MPHAVPDWDAGSFCITCAKQRRDLVHGLDPATEMGGLVFHPDPSQRVPRTQNGSNGVQDSLGFGVKRHSTAVGEAPNSPFNQNSGVWPEYGQGALPHCSDDLANCAPTCPLDTLLIDFLFERRQRAADGLPVQEVIRPRYPSVSSLLNPAQSVYSHPMSKVFTDILQTFPDLSRLPERVAMLYIMFLTMRWRVSPTDENYDRLPEWMRPRRAQLTDPHPAWIDHFLPFPGLRVKLVDDYGLSKIPFDDLFIPFTATLSLNWPYEDTDTLLQHPNGDELMINPVFERHLRRLENWSLGNAFSKAFPGLVGTYNLQSEGSE
ncbi:hypothetical protein B0T10DRAFT_596257 [Thelonectria olida]|uniref:Uncharacterized protein n=1 Tax=Thelonectria olida TaxID=1576542 RepID=A0A9P8VRH3_9HYPO|nr:hypothetical protein B0T10DRAFT_596257 [Thelonectria olida]